VDATVNIEVWDVSGEKVRSLPPFAGKCNMVNNGNNETFWDGRNDSGRPVASGVYIYRVRATTQRGEEAHDFGKAAVLR
jgi:flagellar hook assembly protein FlgD